MAISADDIAKLAHVLHDNGDKILNGCSKLSVNASLLHHIGAKLTSLTSQQNNDQNSNFHVLGSRQSVIKSEDDIRFLHDFFQKTSGLKIVNSANLLDPRDTVDISKFKKLKYLEIKKVPIKQLVGLKVVQHQMECIVCERGLTTLEHLLAECGGDNSTGFVWSELKEAVLSFNDIKIVDSSVAFAPWLQVLDLSHNQIFDVNAIERLPNLKYVNLSYNSLTDIPVFNKSARKKMEVLILKNNHIDNLQRLAGLDCLRELDLSSNMLCCTKSFQPLLAMSSLQFLSFCENPVCKSVKYRLSVIKNLHISASFGHFLLDGEMLSKKEKENVGLELMTSSCYNTINSIVTPVNMDYLPGPSSATAEPLVVEKRKPHKKSGKVRLAVIPNMDGTYEDVLPETKVFSIKTAPSLVHLETKKLIESARALHGDDWLRSKGAGVVTEVLGLPNTTLSSTPYDDSCLAAFLESSSHTLATPPPANIITTIAEVEPVPHDSQNLVSINATGTDSFLSCDDATTNYYSVDESSIRVNVSKEMSPDVETLVDPDEEIEGRDEGIYLAVRLVRDGSEIRREELFLTLTGNDLKEKDVTYGRTVASWCLTSLESVTLLRGRELQLVFDTIRRDRRERCYELDPNDFDEFFKICRAASEARFLAGQHSYCCVACGFDFTIDSKNNKNNLGDAKCPSCGSKVIIVADNEKGSSPAGRLSSTPSSSGRSSSYKSHNRSFSVGGTTSGHPAQYIQKCPSGSSLGSSSDDQRRNRGMHALKCDSDIEIISNPSQSSIEIIDPPPICEPQQEALDGKLLLPSLAAVLFSGLTESSSSGSITDSICTAYEHNSMVSSNISKKSEVSPLLEEPPDNYAFKKTSSIENEFQTLLDDVIKRTEKKMLKVVHRKVANDVDSIVYSYTKFNDLDHRIKLYIYAHLFEDNNELFRFLLRCQILPKSNSTSFDACLVFSDIKMYALKIIGNEEGEDASKFLQRLDSLVILLADFRHWRVLPWNQGFVITYRSGYDKASQFMILLKDSDKAIRFLTFTQQYESMFPKCEWSKSADDDGYMQVMHYLLSIDHEAYLTSFNGLALCQYGEREPLALIPDGAIIITKNNLYLIDSFKWMFPSSNYDFPVPIGNQQISDLMQAMVCDKELRLHFLDESAGKTTIWRLVFTSERILKSVLSDIATPWEQIFAVPLEVSNI